MDREYRKGLHEIAPGVHAYLQPDGSWGWSNAGLIVGDGASALFDTLFDLRLTRQMLDAMAPLTAGAPITTVVNSHANGDHCYGNELVAGDGVEIISAAAAREEMREVPPATVAQLRAAADALPPVLGAYIRRIFGPFQFDGIELTLPTRTFDGLELVVDVGGRRLELLRLGPAHTGGDVIGWLPTERLVFAGDLLFIGGTPIVWAGPVSNWVAACDRMLGLRAEVYVPGHGPLTDAAGVSAVRDYLSFIEKGTRGRFAAGLTPGETIAELDAAIEQTPFSEWTDRERIVVSVHTIWTSLDPDYQRPDLATIFGAMAQNDATRRAELVCGVLPQSPDCLLLVTL